ncbi:MAG TPA: hypothetical protein VMU30_08030 [Bacteroidota bacterium]|nr:hypothetical protein [Bacteroidota bacterium]
MRKDFKSIYTRSEQKIFNELTTPHAIQEFLDNIEYSDESRYRCPRNVLRDGKAHCYDGAIFASAVLQYHGIMPMIVEILPDDNDDDHIIALFHRGTYWGAIGKSNFAGLRYREPVYKTLRELMMTYFESYYNIKQQRTMIGYTSPLILNRFNHLHWQTDDAAMDVIGTALDEVRKYFVLTSQQKKQLTPVHKHFAEAGMYGTKPSGLYQP